MYKDKLKDDLDELKFTDIYSLMLFALYKVKDIPEYSTLSELAYVLDKKNLFNLLNCFGGLTIKIPTVDELKLLVNSLLLYQYVNIENYDYDNAVKLLRLDEITQSELKNAYIKLVDILNKYSFKRT